MSWVGRIVRSVAVVLLASVGSSYASVTPQGVFSEYSSMDGMAHDNIHDIHIDSNGYVWLCTWSGVSRFDGYNFKNYCTDPKNMPVRHNRFRSVDEDGEGNLWFRTYDDHIYRFTPSTEKFEDVCQNIPQLQDKHVRAGRIICSRESQRVWVEYLGVGLMEFYSDKEGRLQSRDYTEHPLLGSSLGEMVVDGQEKLWVATGDGNVVFIDPQGEVQIVLSPLEPIVAMDMGENGIFLATAHKVWNINTSTQNITSATDFNDATISSLEVDAERKVLYIGTNERGVYSHTHEGTLYHFTRGAMPTKVRSMTVDSHGTVWITDTQEGITRLDPTKRDYKHFSQAQNTVQFYTGYNSLIIERHDLVWIKMNHVGFGYYDREKDSVEPFHNDPTKPDFRMSNGVAIFDIDEENVMWLSTHYERGLQRIVLQKQEENLFRLPQHEHLDSSTSPTFLDEVRALENDHKGNLWVGTKEGHLYNYSPSMELLRHINRLPNGEPLGAIYTIKEDTHGNLWVGTKGSGVHRLSISESGTITHRTFRHEEGNPSSLSDDQVYCIEEDAEGHIWIATYGGAINMLPSWDADQMLNTSNSFPLYPTESGERARYLLLDEDNRMLLGTSEGLLTFNPEERPEKMHFTLSQRGINDPKGLQANDVIHILKDSRGEIWLSTYGGGLSRIEGYTSQGVPRYKTYTTSDGLTSNIVFAATEAADGALWLATENGIAKFNPSDESFVSYTNYDSYDEVSYSETAAITNRDGRIIVGSTENALQIFDPLQRAQDTYDYKLRITSFEVQNQEAIKNSNSLSLGHRASQGESIKLSHDYQLFRINFSALNFRLQERVTYMYYLDGYDTGWNTTNDINSVYYTKVPHGKYTFRVKAYVGTPQMASPEVTIPIHITTPPWISWWAWVLYIVLVVGILWLITHLYLRTIKLRNAARLEQDMTEMKLKFFTNISHELRTPLTLIIGGIEEVQGHEELSERATNSLSLSHKNAKRMLTLINQLLDFRKVVKNKMELRVQRVDVVRLAKEVMGNFRDSAAEKHIELIFSFSQDNIYAWCDPERIESLLYNLLSNAIKFTKSKGRITLSVSRSESLEEVVISVSDTGIGIAKERLESIFERFTTFASAVRGEVSGSGIGLALCKEIVELHHGSLKVDSKVGVGTTFTTTLRAGNSHFTMEQIVFGDTEPSDKHQTPLIDYKAAPEGACRVVLAEDNSEMRAFLYNNLAEHYEVIEAVDGQEALEKILSTHPDIVITDLMMPRMDGIELVERIRKDFDISHLPVIMLTAKQTPEDRIMAMKYGADGYITKPFSMELLLARIDNLLTQRKLLFERRSISSAGNLLPEVSPKDVVVTNRDEEFLKNLMEWLEENIENSELTIDLLAGHLRLGRTTMYNKIKSLTGKSPVELIKEYRLTKSEMLLRTGQFSVSEAAYKVGFSDPGYFSRCFKERYKSSPVEYLRKLGIKSN